LPPQNASADSPVKFDYDALEAAAIAFDPTAVVEKPAAPETPAKVTLQPLELQEQSPVFSPEKDEVSEYLPLVCVPQLVEPGLV
jgi:hypothetical protein